MSWPFNIEVKCVDQVSCYISIIQECDKSKSGYLSGEEIEHFYDLLTHREEIDVIYGEYARTTGFMSPENLVDFLMKEQRQEATVAEAHSIIEKFEPDENGQFYQQWRLFQVVTP